MELLWYIAIITCLLVVLLLATAVTEKVNLKARDNHNYYVLLKALLPVRMKCTARDESRVANIARGETKCYIAICHKTLIKSCILSYKQSGRISSVLLHLHLRIRSKVSSKYCSLRISFNYSNVL